MPFILIFYHFTKERLHISNSVATIEVENVISKHLDSAEVVVYGVEIPGQEGRAGMAAIKTEQYLEINLQDLSKKIITDLPAYAKPLFIRLIPQLEHTSTFKAVKSSLANDGFNIEKIKDKLFYFDPTEQNYKELTLEVYEKILSHKIRL